MVYYNARHGDGQTTGSAEPDVDVDCDTGSAAYAAHPFYTRLNRILDKADFEGYVEALCQRFSLMRSAALVCRPGATSACC
jgi:hypothetical protein